MCLEAMARGDANACLCRYLLYVSTSAHTTSNQVKKLLRQVGERLEKGASDVGNKVLSQGGSDGAKPSGGSLSSGSNPDLAQGLDPQRRVQSPPPNVMDEVPDKGCPSGGVEGITTGEGPGAGGTPSDPFPSVEKVWEMLGLTWAMIDPVI